MTISVKHEPDKQRFVTVQDAQESVLEYRLLPDQGIDFTHTFVPVALRGRGIAEKLVRTGLDWARQQEFEITSSCWYVSRFLKRRKRR
ncbi:MAG: GNAT family N-acetyltransferase [Gammaproteobacteria bacterium]|jgi:predicted GNAT family acetyltransferase